MVHVKAEWCHAGRSKTTQLKKTYDVQKTRAKWVREWQGASEQNVEIHKQKSSKA